MFFDVIDNEGRSVKLNELQVVYVEETDGGLVYHLTNSETITVPTDDED